MADTTPTLREAAQQFVQDYENGDLGDLKHYARSMRAARAAEQAEPSEHRPDREWYARMIRETAGDDFVAGPAFKLPEQAEQAEPVAGFRLLPSRLTNEMRAAMADAARAYMARTGGNSPDAMYDAAVAAAPPAPARQEPLTESQVDDLIHSKHFDRSYKLHASDETCLRWYRLGLRDGEHAHGIVAAPAEGGA